MKYTTLVLLGLAVVPAVVVAACGSNNSLGTTGGGGYGGYGGFGGFGQTGAGGAQATTTSTTATTTATVGAGGMTGTGGSTTTGFGGSGGMGATSSTTSGGTMCAPGCKMDSDCMNSCPATMTGTNCCDQATGVCYLWGSATCPPPQMASAAAASH